MRATSNGVTVKAEAYHDAATASTNACKRCALWKRRCTKLDSDLGVAVQAAEALTQRSCFTHPYIWIEEDV